ncbi:hypothetical protein BCR33DRAFT_553269 [Rhizoclosmatium globosum]|uniref:Uncharacterized protein n=1 Tax=Rhizoclosmatium globosum TaxID=329046 RepID=A0A1Y2CSH8_9FUNG|nr:hypothetical protein BCR33DRAFT_553269 [Rhizoclosmatium globosum]|eukprot:ORY49814.1 hypothetical protein BCR33DRAFT_553269 [Rhizoclosmatium globosum]
MISDETKAAIVKKSSAAAAAAVAAAAAGLNASPRFDVSPLSNLNMIQPSQQTQQQQPTIQQYYIHPQSHYTQDSYAPQSLPPKAPTSSTYSHTTPLNMTAITTQLHINPTQIPPPQSFTHPTLGPTVSWTTTLLAENNIHNPSTELTDAQRRAFTQCDALILAAVKSATSS